MGSAVGDGDAGGGALSLAEAAGDGDLVGVAFWPGVVVVAGEVLLAGDDGAEDGAEDGAVGWGVLPAGVVVAVVAGGANQA